MAQSYNALSSLTITPRDRWQDGDPVESRTGFSCYCGIGKKP
jgi:hypothetical protein